jgi:hypothetical protein
MSRKWVFVLPENPKRDVRPPLLAKGVVCIGTCAEKISPFEFYETCAEAPGYC